MGKPRKLPYQIITPDEVVLAGQPYELLDEVRAEQHFDCVEARIALAWRKGTKPNVDGHLVLGRCVLLNALAREMVPFDYVIVLNREVWEDPEFTREKKLALLDHEMCHTAPALDADGDKVRDTKGGSAGGCAGTTSRSSARSLRVMAVTSATWRSSPKHFWSERRSRCWRTSSRRRRRWPTRCRHSWLRRSCGRPASATA
jgi:hypothetical protein